MPAILQQALLEFEDMAAVVPIPLPTLAMPPLPAGAADYPQLRYMGSKHRLLPWVHSVLSECRFSSALDAFSGSGCVSYLMKRMGKRVCANDFLHFSSLIGIATIANSTQLLTEEDCRILLRPNRKRKQFIERTFAGVFYEADSLRFLDNFWANLPQLESEEKRALALSSIFRACVKKQPRGVFTVTGDPLRYDDGRRDLRLSLRDHFLESSAAFNQVIFDNGQTNTARHGDVYDLPPDSFDLVYMDPPYVPRADDNCYIKRYHFLEGLASYWRAPGTEILKDTLSHKIPKRFTPFSYRRTAVDAFRRLFHHFRRSTLVLSYSSNGYPNLATLVELMREVKPIVVVHEKEHRYHFGTHQQVAEDRATVREFLIVGSE
jgi:DNA adenine methylase/adenine-specific DNA-methyltransferase